MKSGNELELLKRIEFNNYKSFKSDNLFDVNFDKNITLIIGRNNSGKSSVIDVIEQALTESRNLYDIGELQYVYLLNERHIASGFDRSVSGYPFSGNHFDYGIKHKNEELAICKEEGRFVASYTNQSLLSNCENEVKNIWDKVASSYNGTLSNVCLRRITAERDVYQEIESDSEIVEKNGIGATNLIRKFLNNDYYDERVVEEKILNELNVIMNQDAQFDRILIQQVSDLSENGKYKWEIFLVENGHRFALSKSGSGLKTIILILINLYLIPLTSEYRNKKIVYAFEEVENNLHPALQRRMFEYLYEYSINNHVKIFLSSHSHIAINSYYGKESADIYHVLKKDGLSSIVKIESGIEKLNILDDLDVKASDLFQTNGIIWVEGPSDRVYIKRWLEIFTENDIKEGQDYQFAYYGGKLLSHYEASEKNDEDDLINVLRTNRHAAIVMDSDRRIKGGKLNKTKLRVKDEFSNNGLFCWITKGKEIENYVSAEAINKFYNASLKQIEEYELFPDYIRKYEKDFSPNKIKCAREYIKYITEENSNNILDLKEQVIKLYTEIKKW